LRASDHDRDQVADRLREALAEGRLTTDEHAERIEAVYAAKTYADLAPIIADIPGPAGTPSAAEPELARSGEAPPHESSTIVAIFGGAERKGRWLVEPHTNIFCMFGGVELDLRQAVLSQREVTINIVAIMGGASIVVPPGVHVSNNITGILGGTSVTGDSAVSANAPVVRLTGMALLGGVDVNVREVPGGGNDAVRDSGLRGLRDRERDLRDLERQHHREMRERRRELRDMRRHGRGL
jgi:hypothetical protein